MRTVWLLLLVAACHKDAAPGSPASTSDADTLWKMAPDGAVVGFVASPRALQMTEHAYGDVTKFLDAIPEIAPALVKMRAELKAELGTDVLTLDAVGMTGTKGIAVFMRQDKRGFAVLPVADRDKFLKVVHGTKGDPLDTFEKTVCKTVSGAYVCASDKDMFDAIGKGAMDVKDAGARGDLELVVKNFDMHMSKKLDVSVVGQLERGQVTFRGSANVGGLPIKFPAPAKPRTDGKTTGFAMGFIKPWFGLIGMPRDKKALFGVMPGDLIDSIDDPITMTMSSTTIDAQVPLNNPTPFKTIIDHCGDLPAQLNAKTVDGACEMPLPNYPGVVADVWVDGKTLHVGQKKPAAASAIELSPLEREIAASEWHYAFAGRGSILAATPEIWAQFDAMKAMMPADLTEMFQSMFRGMMMLNEVGVAAKVDGDTIKFIAGMRTGWANPDDVVAKMMALDPAAVTSGKAGDFAKSVPANSPLANDIKAGYMGAMIPASIVGVLAAVSVPAFMEYTRRAKKTEASLYMNKLGKNLKVVFITNAQFPIGDAPLTPAKSCCGQPQDKCPVDASQWQSDIWKQLDFEIDEPSRYQYSYHSDGKTAQATAVGDLDCDGVMATYKLTASQDQGNPSFVIDGPPPGVQ